MSKLRTLHKNTMQTLGAPHALPTLTVPFLFLMLVGVGIFLLCRFLAVLMVLYLSRGMADLLQLTVIPCLAFLLVAFLALPLWLGRLRMAGLVLAGETPLYGSCFYYFKHPKRYRRALGISVLLALVYGLAGLAVYGIFAGTFSVYYHVILYYVPEYALPLLLLLLHVALAGTAGVIYLAGAFLPFAAVAVGNEELSAGGAFVRAVRAGRKNMPGNFVFALRQMLWLALCLVSVMVLYVMWYSHYFNLFYLRYSMEVTQ